METMRDAFFNTLYPLAKADPDIMVLSSDFSAPAFDRYRVELPGQFVNTGISEQNTILTASGLALSGMKVFVVSIAPFITKRCFEQIQLFPADLNLDVTIVGVGAGFSYVEAGATHHAVEDIGLMHMLPNMRVLSACDNAQVRDFVGRIMRSGGPHYVRVDRRALPDVYPAGQAFGNSLASPIPGGRVKFLATGYMTHTALRLAERLKAEGIDVGVVDAFRLPLDADEFAAAFAATELIVSLEEHVAAGGLGAQAREMLDKIPSPVSLRSFALDMAGGLCHSYGDRNTLHERHGVSEKTIMQVVKTFITGGK